MATDWESLYRIVERQGPLTQEGRRGLSEAFEPLAVSRNTVLEPVGKPPAHLYFVSSGYLRLSHLDQEGRDNTRFFGVPDQFITSFLSFIHQTSTEDQLISITDTELLRITHTDLKDLIERSESFKAFSLILFEQAIADVHQRANDLASLTGEQRYRKLLDQQPQLLQHVPLQYIASYLGIKPESLSRIRRQMNS